jgi:hypothetical protein
MPHAACNRALERQQKQIPALALQMPPGPLKDFSMNLFLAKQVHHLLGFPSVPSKTFSHRRLPVTNITQEV